MLLSMLLPQKLLARKGKVKSRVEIVEVVSENATTKKWRSFHRLVGIMCKERVGELTKCLEVSSG